VPDWVRMGRRDAQGRAPGQTLQMTLNVKTCSTGNSEGCAREAGLNVGASPTRRVGLRPLLITKRPWKSARISRRPATAWLGCWRPVQTRLCEMGPRRSSWLDAWSSSPGARTRQSSERWRRPTRRPDDFQKRLPGPRRRMMWPSPKAIGLWQPRALSLSNASAPVGPSTTDPNQQFSRLGNNWQFGASTTLESRWELRGFRGGAFA